MKCHYLWFQGNINVRLFTYTFDAMKWCMHFQRFCACFRKIFLTFSLNNFFHKEKRKHFLFSSFRLCRRIILLKLVYNETKMNWIIRTWIYNPYTIILYSWCWETSRISYVKHFYRPYGSFVKTIKLFGVVVEVAWNMFNVEWKDKKECHAVEIWLVQWCVFCKNIRNKNGETV